jgi:predicted dehydrogenase
VNADDATAALRIALAALQSARTGQAVDIPEGAGV